MIVPSVASGLSLQAESAVAKSNTPRSDVVVAAKGILFRPITLGSARYPLSRARAPLDLVRWCFGFSGATWASCALRGGSS